MPLTLRILKRKESKNIIQSRFSEDYLSSFEVTLFVFESPIDQLEADGRRSSQGFNVIQTVRWATLVSISQLCKHSTGLIIHQRCQIVDLLQSTCSIRAWGEWMKYEVFPLGAHCRQSWLSVETGLYRKARLFDSLPSYKTFLWFSLRVWPASVSNLNWFL